MLKWVLSILTFIALFVAVVFAHVLMEVKVGGGFVSYLMFALIFAGTRAVYGIMKKKEEQAKKGQAQSGQGV